MKAAVGLILIIAMGGLFWTASQTASPPVAVLWFFLGSALGTFGSLWLTPTLARWFGFGTADGGVEFATSRDKAFAFAAMAVAAAAIFVGLAAGPKPLMWVGLAVAALAAGFIDIQIDRGDVPVPWIWLCGGALMMAVGAWVAITGTELPIGIGNGGVALVFLGFPVLKVGLPRALGDPDATLSGWVRFIVTFAAAAALVTGAVLLIIGAFDTDPAWRWVGLGFSILSIGYALVVEIGLRLWTPGTTESPSARRPQAKRGSMSFLIAGAVAVGLGIYIAFQLAVTLESYALLLMIAAFAVGMFFALRGESALFVFAVGFVLIWVTWERTPAEQVLDPGETNIVIGLGDSYMAGQGASRFFEFNNTAMPIRIVDDGQQGEEPTRAPVVDGGSDCRRSPKALPARLAHVYGEDWAAVNLACSGARIRHIDQDVKHPHGDRVNDDGRAFPGTLTQLDELAGLDEAVRDRVRLVVVSIGGNDSGFSKVIMACLLPTDCTSQVQALNEQVPAALAGLGEAYAAVSAAADDLGGGDSPDVVVIPYPEFLDNKECGLTLSATERDAVLTFQRTLNAEIIQQATVAGLEVFEDGQHAYTDGLKLCDDGGRGETSGANFLYLMPHDPLGGLSPATWVQGSMHPRPDGHRRMAEALECTYSGGSGCVTVNPPVIEPPDVEPVSEDIDEWTSRNLRRSVTQVAGALALIMGGGLLVALGLYHGIGRWLSDDNWLRAVFPRP